MADDLLGLIQDALVKQGPTYAQNRFTQAPMILGAQPGVDPGAGATQSPDTHGDLASLASRLLVTGKMLGNGMMPGQMASGLIRVSPTPNDPADTHDTIRHESIHSLLDHAGVDGQDLVDLTDNSPAGQRLMLPYLQAGRKGISGIELPAYVRSGNKYLPGSDPKDRDTYRKEIADYLRTVKKNPKAADTYLKLAQEE